MCFISNYLISEVQKLNVNSLSLFKIISLSSLLNAVMFYKNAYANSSASEALRYDINLSFFVSQSTIVRIKSYKMFVNNFFDKDNLTMKFIITNVHD